MVAIFSEKMATIPLNALAPAGTRRATAERASPPVSPQADINFERELWETAVTLSAANTTRAIRSSIAANHGQRRWSRLRRVVVDDEKPEGSGDRRLPTTPTESTFELATIQRLQALGYRYLHASDSTLPPSTKLARCGGMGDWRIWFIAGPQD